MVVGFAGEADQLDLHPVKYPGDLILLIYGSGREGGTPLPSTDPLPGAAALGDGLLIAEEIAKLPDGTPVQDLLEQRRPLQGCFTGAKAMTSGLLPAKAPAPPVWSG